MSETKGTVNERAALMGIGPGQPRKNPPPNAAQTIQDLAADGWSVVGIAWKLGCSKKVFYGWLENDETLREAIEIGRQRSEHVLYNVMFRKAVEGEGKDSTLACIYLLNTRHGYRSEQPEDHERRVNITINLPAARPMSDFIEISNADGSETHRLPNPRT